MLRYWSYFTRQRGQSQPSRRLELQTAVKYYEASTEYGVKRVKEACFKWLLINLLSFQPETPKRLREIRFLN